MEGESDPRLREILRRFPSNEFIYERLKETLSTGEAIAFVGAGASTPLYPLWGDLIHELANETCRRGLVDEATRNYWLGPDMDQQWVVRRIKTHLGDREFAGILNKIFAYKQGEDGNYYTPAHSALIRMSFAGYVTTNYDPGLLEARIALREDVRATGHCDWTHHHLVGSWVTNDIFQEDQCPILYAHGFFESSDDIVLEEEGYGRAYSPSPYSRLFEKLWQQHRLVFVGFGFRDPWIKYIVHKVLSELTFRTPGSPRHIAIVGLPEATPYTPERWHMFVNSFDAYPLFYPVHKLENGGQDHSALTKVLDSLATHPVAKKALLAESVRSSNQAVDDLKAHWEHQTTEDGYYVGRRVEMTRLDRWSDDDRVRVIAVRGIGGLGKTSLVGHWLKTQGGATRRHVKGLFYWSFYVNRNVTGFLKALIMFVREELGCTMTDSAETLPEQAVSYLCNAPLLVVLDGLEVMQKERSMSAYRSLLENELREFLNMTCRSEHGGLVIVTSRFLLADLKPFLGTSVRLLDLDRLTLEEGAELLRRLGAEGTQPELREVSRQLEGHPLALRLFAGVLKTQAHAEPMRLCQVAFDQVHREETDPLRDKLEHLLTFYENQMSVERSMLLGIVSLFRSSVTEATVLDVARRLMPTKDLFETTTDHDLLGKLEQLEIDRFVAVEQGETGNEYTCHPILRNHFRRALLQQDRSVAIDVAALLMKRSSAEKITSIKQLQPILNAIELLQERGEFAQADKLFKDRLEDGRLLRRLLAHHEAMQCAIGFVSSVERRQQFEQQVSASRLAFYLNSAALNAADLGEVNTARRFREEAVGYCRQSERLEDRKNLSIALQNKADMLSALGRLVEAEKAAREALEVARKLETNKRAARRLGARKRFRALRKLKPEEEVYSALVYLGHTLSLSGSPSEAMAAFEEADDLCRRLDTGLGGLHSEDGLKWADLLLRDGQLKRAKDLTLNNLDICRRQGFQQSIARCWQYLGRMDTLEGRFQPAADNFKQAETIFRNGPMMRFLDSSLLFPADLHRQRENWNEALHCVEEALHLAMPRGLALVHADALILRGRISLDRFSAAHDAGKEQVLLWGLEAVNDGGDALSLTEDSRYVWAERDSQTLLADAHDALGNTDEARRHRQEAELLDKRL